MRPEDDVSRSIAEDDRSKNHHVISGLNESTGRDIGELCRRGGGQVINLNQTNTGRAADAFNHRSISARIQGHDQRGLFRLGRRDTAGDDCTYVVAILPVIVRSNDGSGRIMDFQIGIKQRIAGEVGASEVPIARMITFFGPEPVTIKPPIITLSPIPTFSRVEMLPSSIGVGLGVGVVGVGVMLGVGLESVWESARGRCGGRSRSRCRSRCWSCCRRWCWELALQSEHR